ncbi:MAG TPA: lysophospholipid acyltransferase family protein [Gemmatimonadales bacterium]|nr:lysophospholipid acyltransferase family protein [Gemmatimonadales bacterium]
MLGTVWYAIRSACGLVLIVLYTLVIATYLIILTHINDRSRQITPLMRSWGRLFLFVAGVKMETEGAERLDPNGSYVVVSNHLSNLDAPLHIATMPVSVRFLAKKELFKIPIFGSAMRSIGIVETDRMAGPTAHRAINRQVARVVDLQRSLVIYPEGTRSKDGELHAFKKGAFRIAVDNEMPVVPVTISGTQLVWPPGHNIVRPGTVKMVIHAPIPTAGLQARDIDALRDRVHETVTRTWERIRP